MQNIGRILGAYLFPALLIVMGILLLAVSGGQTGLFQAAGLGILIVGILSALYVKGVISRQIQMVITILVAVGAIAFAYYDWAVIDEQLTYYEQEKKVKTAIPRFFKFAHPICSIFQSILRNAKVKYS